MRTTALPGPGLGVGSVWTVGGEEVEVKTRARWVWGRGWSAMGAWSGACGGGMGVVMLGSLVIRGFESNGRNRGRGFM